MRPATAVLGLDLVEMLRNGSPVNTSLPFLAPIGSIRQARIREHPGVRIRE